MECAAAVDVITIRGLAAPADVAVLGALFVRAIQMLTKLDDALAWPAKKKPAAGKPLRACESRSA